MAVHRRDDHALREHVCHFVPAGDFQYLTRREGRVAGDGMGLRLAIQVALMTNAGIKRPGLRGRMAVMVTSRCQVVISPVVSLPTGGGVPAGRIDLGVHVFRGLTVVVIPGADLLLHHVMVALHAPDRVHAFRMLS
ncbi:hypothetical protein D3C71_1360340 [compost metagenome]